MTRSNRSRVPRCPAVANLEGAYGPRAQPHAAAILLTLDALSAAAATDFAWPE
jgi:hypothetical protein